MLYFSSLAICMCIEKSALTSEIIVYGKSLQKTTLASKIILHGNIFYDNSLQNNITWQQF